MKLNRQNSIYRGVRSLLILSLISILQLLFTVAAFAQGSSLAKPSWAKDFIGVFNIRLTDDPTYNDQLAMMTRLQTELTTITTTVAQKQTAVDAATRVHQQNVAFMAEKQQQLEDDTEEQQLIRSQKATKEVQVTALNNDIATQTANIRIKENELITLRNVYNPLVDSMNSSKEIAESKKQAYEAALQSCQAANPSANCFDADAVLAAKTRWDQAKDVVRYYEEQVAHFGQLIGDAERSLAASQKTISDNQKSLAVLTKEIADINKRISELEKSIPELAEQISRFGKEMEEHSKALAALNQELTTLTGVKLQAQRSFDLQKTNFEKVEQDLIREIIAVNREGYETGLTHGGQEGIATANDIGGRKGTQDGDTKGTNDGVTAGRKRDYDRGAAEGRIAGLKDGEDQGQSAGTLKGHQDGYTEAGARDGLVAGAARAEKSDAASVGRTEGFASGKVKAQSDGVIQGSKQGEEEAIRENEAQPLRKIEISGAFAGTFNSRLPQFPGVKGTFSNSSSAHTKVILKNVYKSGYDVGYPTGAERTYTANVQAIYDSAYKTAFDKAYAKALSVIYQDSYQLGYNQVYKSNFDSSYSQAFDAAWRITHASALQNPDKNSSLYKSSFTQNEASSYTRRYAEIRAFNFQIAEKESYDQLIVSEIQKGKAKRASEINALYVSFPVIKFVSHSISDGGVSGVGFDDSVYQPSERIVHTVEIANFGRTAASNVKVKLSSGQEVVIPAIPGQTSAVIKGAAEEIISANTQINAQVSPKISLLSSLSSSEKNIQGHHFSSVSSGILVANVTKQVKVSLPLAISSLSLSSPLVLNQPSALIGSISNVSSKQVIGPVTFDILSSHGSSIARSFSDVGMIGTNVTIDDAQVLVTRNDDVFDELSFDLVIKKNGVVIGRTTSTLRDIVRVPYIAKDGAPVVAFSSAVIKSRELAKDVAAELGGVEEVSFLDVDGGKAHIQVLDKNLKGKTLYVIEDSRKTIVSKMNEFFKNANVLAVFVKDGAEGALASAKSSVPALRLATSFALEIEDERVQVVSTNSISNDLVTSKVSAIELGMRELSIVPAIEKFLKMTEDQLVSEVAAKMSVTNFLSADRSTVALGKIALMRVFEEVDAINLGYLNYGSKKDRTFKGRVDDDASFIFNKFNMLMKSGTNDQKLNLAVFACALDAAKELAFDEIAPYEGTTFAMKWRLKDNFKDNYSDAKKIYKSVGKDKKLGTKLEPRAATYLPFAM